MSWSSVCAWWQAGTLGAEQTRELTDQTRAAGVPL